MLKSPSFWKELPLVQVVTYQVMYTGCNFLRKSSDPNLLSISFYFGSPYEGTIVFKKVVGWRCGIPLGPSYTWISRSLLFKKPLAIRSWVFIRYPERSGPPSSGKKSGRSVLIVVLKESFSSKKRRSRSKFAKRLPVPFCIRQSVDELSPINPMVSNRNLLFEAAVRCFRRCKWPQFVSEKRCCIIDRLCEACSTRGLREMLTQACFGVLLGSSWVSIDMGWIMGSGHFEQQSSTLLWQTKMHRWENDCWRT